MTLLEAKAASVYDPALEWVKEHCCELQHDEWVRRSVRELTRPRYEESDLGHFYDALVLLDGWKESTGATMEVAVAEACGIPVYELGDVLGD